jgi:murein DD-endopeptidase MepM/ murein hydrolase activator NlpD
MQYRRRARSGPRFTLLPILLMLVLAAVGAGLAFVLFRMIFAGRPQVALAAPFDVVGRNAPLALDIKDPRHGLRQVRVAIRQGDKEQVILEESYPSPRPEVSVRWSPAQDRPIRLQDGPGHLSVQAKNASWGNFLRGRTTSLEKDFTARLVPPRLEVLSGQHYVNQGGCDMVVYKVTPASAENGVVVGERFFKGFAMPGAKDPAVRFAIFCLPYDVPAGTPVRVKATDEARNEVLAGFWLKVFPKAFRSREIALDDGFLNKVVPEIMSQTPSLTDQGDLMKNFLQINRDLRKVNNKALADLTAQSRPEFLWHAPFQQLGNSQVEAQFADHRTYVYQGREVDRQDHLGFDLATTANAPVTAANDGLVALAEFFGIYGNTLVIDHGYGLMSVYGHLSSFAVNKGDRVTRGQKIAQSGATGLAGGDHLHFSMLFQPVQVDPREWWDPHWIEDRLAAKIRQWGTPVGPAASPASETASAASGPRAQRR